MNKPKLYYIYDALCGWCYGFNPVILKLYERFHREIDFEIISGGMIIGNTAGPVGFVAPYIKESHKRVEESTGIHFGDAFHKKILEPGTTYFSSEKPAIALCIIKEIKPEISFKYASALQNAIYYRGMGPDEYSTYEMLAKEFSLNEKLFIKSMKSSSYIIASRNEFKRVFNMGVRGFPAVFIEQDYSKYLITNGYMKYELLEKKLHPILRLTGVLR